MDTNDFQSITDYETVASEKLGISLTMSRNALVKERRMPQILVRTKSMSSFLESLREYNI